MSQIPNKNDDNRSVAASDFVQLDQADEVPDQQHQGQSQFGVHQNALDWTLETGSTHNNCENGFKEMKWMIANLQAKIETLQSNLKNLELEAKIRAMEEKAEHKAKYQALEAKMNEVAQMLSTQNEEHHKEMEQLKDGFTKEMAQLKDGFAQMLSTQNEQHQMEKLEAKNLKLEEKLMNNVELQTTKNGALEAKMEQLHDEFSKKLAEQQTQMMAQFQAQHSLELKLKEAEQRAQTGKNELEEIIQQKMEKFRKEMDKNGQQSIGSNLSKLDFMWTRLMAKIKTLANPKGIVWDASKSTNANISECGLKFNGTRTGCVVAIATEGYAISGEHCREENYQFPGTIVYYYETTITSNIFGYYSVGFTDGRNPVAGRYVGGSPNSYGISEKRGCWLSGKEHKLECPCGAIAGGRVAGKKHNFDRPIGSFDAGDVFGSGLLLNSKDELAVFFTLNGILLGKKIRINPTVNRLYPTMSIFHAASVEANFGDNLVTHPFQYDVDKCPGLVFE